MFKAQFLLFDFMAICYCFERSYSLQFKHMAVLPSW